MSAATGEDVERSEISVPYQTVPYQGLLVRYLVERRTVVLYRTA